MSLHVQANVDRFSGFAHCYDRYRPQPPVVITEMLTQLLGVRLPALVVDLGCGTGLSTRIWVGRARRIIGIEPNADMRRVAVEHTPACHGIRYQDGVATRTGLPAAAADIVCCSQAFHWMEPEATVDEVARVLRPGGIFAVIDCDWPPTVHWQVEQAYQELTLRVIALSCQYNVGRQVTQWPKDQHLANLAASGCFRYTKEILVHHQERGNADRLVGLALSQGSVESLLKYGLSAAEIGLDAFRATAERILGDSQRPWYFSYRIRLGVK